MKMKMFFLSFFLSRMMRSSGVAAMVLAHS